MYSGADSTTTDNEMVSITKKELDSRISTSLKVGAGAGALLVGTVLLFDKKVERTTSIGIMAAGAFIIGLALIFRKIDKMPETEISKS